MDTASTPPPLCWNPPIFSFFLCTFIPTALPVCLSAYAQYLLRACKHRQLWGYAFCWSFASSRERNFWLGANGNILPKNLVLKSPFQVKMDHCNIWMLGWRHTSSIVMPLRHFVIFLLSLLCFPRSWWLCVCVCLCVWLSLIVCVSGSRWEKVIGPGGLIGATLLDRMEEANTLKPHLASQTSFFFPPFCLKHSGKAETCMEPCDVV